MKIAAEKRTAVKERLEQIAAANGGRLTPDAVVADAKKKDSPLHEHFTWDVKKAAEAYWIEQARTLITSVRVTVVTESTNVRSVFYVRDPSADAKVQGYVSVVALQSDEDKAREVLLTEFAAIADRLRRARALALAIGFDREVEGLLENVVGLRRQVEGPSATQ